MTQGAHVRTDLRRVISTAKCRERCALTSPLLPNDVIPPVPPLPANSGAALGKARSFFKQLLAGMRG